MLELERAHHVRRSGGVSESGIAIERFGFGAVAFELIVGPSRSESSPRSFRALLPADIERHVLPESEPQLIADVLCSIAYAAEGELQEPELGNRVQIAQDGDALEIRCKSVHALLSRTAPRRYACSARIDRDSEAHASLLRAVSAAIVQREGGFVLHAAGIELDGRAVLFLGPSGRGKSTAALLTQGARAIAHDHVAIVPSRADGARYLAFGLPGGRAAKDLALSARTLFPLGALVRIVRDPSATRMQLARLAGADALFAVRAAVELPERTEDPERLGTLESACLLQLQRLVEHVEVAALTTVLGHDPSALLGELLAHGPDRSRGAP